MVDKKCGSQILRKKYAYPFPMGSFLILLVIIVLAPRVQGSPPCYQICDEPPPCNATCTPKCLHPVCTTQCQDSHSECNPLHCTTRCPEDAGDPDTQCPSCETVCDPPVCAPDGAACDILCEMLECGWSCVKSGACREKTCQVMCEQPVCAVDSSAAALLMSPLILLLSVLVA